MRRRGFFLVFTDRAMAFPGSPRPPRSPKPPAATSLKAQAISLLSRREHSRQELRAKLLAALARREREAAAFAAAQAQDAAAIERALRATPPNGIDDAFAPRSCAAPAPEPTHGMASSPVADARGGGADDPQAEVDALLDWLEAHGYLSDARFVESRVHARVARHGMTRIKHELARHGLALEPAQAAALRETEYERARAIWLRKFGQPGVDARERARQARFLAARGFAADVVRRVVGGDEF